MNRNKCLKCEHDHFCCSPDLFTIEISAEEATKLKHVRTKTGQFLIPANENGRCIYQDEKGKCSIYNDRPNVCRDWFCTDEKIKYLVDKKEEISNQIGKKYSGFVVVFIYSTDRVRIPGKLKIIDPNLNKETEIEVATVYGNSEEEIKQKMVDIINAPFKKENI